MSIRLLIADDQEVARSGLKSFVAGTEIEVVAEAATGSKAAQLTLSHRPHVVLMAVQMPIEDGLSALKRIKQKRSKLPVIMIANRDHPTRFARAHKLGAAGYLTKDVDRETLLATIRTAASGKQLWTRSQVRRITGVLATPRLDVEFDAPLTCREGEVLCGMTEGKTNLEIANQLGISYETVKEHVQHVLRKIGVDDRTQAAVWAVRNGLA